MSVQVQCQGDCRSQVNLFSQKYFDRLIFDAEDQYLAGQWEDLSQLGRRNNKESCWEPCSLCELKIDEQ